VELDGETVVRCIRTSATCIRASRSSASTALHQIIPLTDRTDYLSPMSNNVGLALAAEKLMGIEITPRCTVLRVIACEMSRIISHMGLAWHDVDRSGRVHAVPVGVPGARADLRPPGDVDRRALTTSLTRVGGLMADIPDQFVGKLREFTRTFPRRWAKSIACSRATPVWAGRTQGVGTLSAPRRSTIAVRPDAARQRRALDVRKDKPYLGYETYDFRRWWSVSMATSSTAIWYGSKSVISRPASSSKPSTGSPTARSTSTTRA